MRDRCAAIARAGCEIAAIALECKTRVSLDRVNEKRRRLRVVKIW